MRSPSVVRRSTNHSEKAVTAAKTKTISWLESKLRAPRCQILAGDGPIPGAMNTWSPVGMLKWPSLTRISTVHLAMAGTATRTPTVAMILADSLALVRGLKIRRSRTNPSSGAKIPMTTTAEGTMGQPSPLWSSK